MSQRIKLTKELIKKYEINDFLDGDNCECGDCVFAKQILENEEISDKARAMKNYGDAVELMEWIKKHE